MFLCSHPLWDLTSCDLLEPFSVVFSQESLGEESDDSHLGAGGGVPMSEGEVSEEELDEILLRMAPEAHLHARTHSKRFTLEYPDQGVPLLGEAKNSTAITRRSAFFEMNWRVFFFLRESLRDGFPIPAFVGIVKDIFVDRRGLAEWMRVLWFDSKVLQGPYSRASVEGATIYENFPIRRHGGEFETAFTFIHWSPPPGRVGTTEGYNYTGRDLVLTQDKKLTSAARKLLEMDVRVRAALNVQEGPFVDWTAPTFQPASAEGGASAEDSDSGDSSPVRQVHTPASAASRSPRERRHHDGAKRSAGEGLGLLSEEQRQGRKKRRKQTPYAEDEELQRTHCPFQGSSTDVRTGRCNCCSLLPYHGGLTTANVIGDLDDSRRTRSAHR